MFSVCMCVCVGGQIYACVYGSMSLCVVTSMFLHISLNMVLFYFVIVIFSPYPIQDINKNEMHAIAFPHDRVNRIWL